MATTTRRQQVVKQDDAAALGGELIADHIETLARAGACEMLMAAFNDEGDAYLGRGRYELSADAGTVADGPPSDTVRAYRRYRNGTTPRRLTLGSGTVALKQPRVRDVPPDQEPYESKIIRKYQRRSDTIDETFMKLFIEGLVPKQAFGIRLLAGGAVRAGGRSIDRPLFC